MLVTTVAKHQRILLFQENVAQNELCERRALTQAYETHKNYVLQKYYLLKKKIYYKVMVHGTCLSSKVERQKPF